MGAEVRERTSNIRGVEVRWVDVIVAGHTIEQVLSFDVAEAEAVHGRSFDDEMDNSMQMGMFAIDRISADGTMHKVASAVSYVLDGKCVRTAKIERCQDIEPISAGWTIIREGRELQQPPWSCVPGTPPMSHAELLREIDKQAALRKDVMALAGPYWDDEITMFLYGVEQQLVSNFDDGDSKPIRTSGWARSLDDDYRVYLLWHNVPPWSQSGMSYRICLRQVTKDEDAPEGASWLAYVEFTYPIAAYGALERWIHNPHVNDDPTDWLDDLDDEDQQPEDVPAVWIHVDDDQEVRTVLSQEDDPNEFRVISVSRYGNALDKAFADTLSDTLRHFIEVITPAVDAYALSLSQQTDEVTDFLREVGERAIAMLTDALKPDEKSEYADGSGDRRSYSLWYSRPPWQGDGLSYTISLLPETVDEDDASWLGYVGLSYWAIEDKSLISEIEALHVYDDQSIAMGNIDVSRRGDDLGEASANTLAETLRHFIEIVTPVVDASANERNGGDV